ncbi:hypothetical protein [Pedobacter sp. JCM 36344]|uniref:hypothetical protein n=1 Tax=Pedobacter sp. JCM 36344 TaxID=3374280 RepID=UPI00397D1839
MYWRLNNKFIRTTTNYHQLAISHSAGKHLLTIVDDNRGRQVKNFIIFDKDVNLRSY